MQVPREGCWHHQSTCWTHAVRTPLVLAAPSLWQSSGAARLLSHAVLASALIRSAQLGQNPPGVQWCGGEPPGLHCGTSQAPATGPAQLAKGSPQARGSKPSPLGLFRMLEARQGTGVPAEGCQGVFAACQNGHKLARAFPCAGGSWLCGREPCPSPCALETGQGARTGSRACSPSPQGSRPPLPFIPGPSGLCWHRLLHWPRALGCSRHRTVLLFPRAAPWLDLFTTRGLPLWHPEICKVFGEKAILLNSAAPPPPGSSGVAVGGGALRQLQVYL